MAPENESESGGHPPDVQQHLKLVSRGRETGTAETCITSEQLQTMPLFSSKVRRVLRNAPPDSLPNLRREMGDAEILPQFGLMGIRLETYGKAPSGGTEKDVQKQDGNAEEASDGGDTPKAQQQPQDDRDLLVYGNINAPWSAFICGSQGSGKSHTLSCMLENSLLMPSDTGNLTVPLTALALHYDKFTGIETGQLCEAAYLCSSGITVRVLVSPSNFSRMKKLYENLPGLPDGAKGPEVVPMKFLEKHLSIGMMKSLMAVGPEGSSPLYMEVVNKVLREMAEEGKELTFSAFKYQLNSQNFAKGQSGPLNMRLRLLESFLDIDHDDFFSPWAPRRSNTNREKTTGNVAWEFKKGTLTIIDLSCPFVDENDACALFNICLGIFLERRDKGGRIIALDEAHKFLTTRSREATTLTETMLSLIRQQRHLATRVIIATQEPTLSPNLLDLCSVTIVHRFTSPAWFKMLRSHLAGAVIGASNESKTFSDDSIFSQIVCLKTGEALVFSPSAILDVDELPGLDANPPLQNDKEHDNEPSGSIGAGSGAKPGGSMTLCELGPRHIKMRVRSRVTTDGGRSILAQ